MRILGTTIGGKAATAAAVAALAAGAIGAAAATGGATTLEKAVGEKAVDACKGTVTNGKHGIGDCVSDFVLAHNHGHRLDKHPSGPSGPSGAEGKSDVNHGHSAANGGAGSGTPEGKSDSTHGTAPTSPGKSGSHKP